MDNRKTDEELLVEIGRHDNAAVRTMVTRKLPRLLALAARMLGDRNEAEDVAQEAFVKLWRQAGKWQSGRATFDTWLHRVTLNLCYDRLRLHREQPVAEAPDRPDPAPDPEQSLSTQDESARVQQALASLPDRQREAIVLQYYQELSNIEAAEIMDISIEALESLLSRARRNLRTILEKADEQEKAK
ncbi:RNA polymerase sigma factor [Phyllobacterium sp. 628]|uniref:RNA polymerase sigma factor n=1 Tax=Phyllobacterium sp. 628 TaxID=2718938 RepID=UPI0016623C33|nr:RNA polymerase sigma factor [Phyllobacterium sp. 628]QND50908.1 RNA polymerase sigma factor [Phyllobacterium sp. 628]